MQNLKKLVIAILILLLTSITLTTIAVQPTQAQLATTQPVSGPLPTGVTVDNTLETKTSLSFRPNPIGLGQQLLINMWINPAVTSNNRFLPKAFVLTITKPDGTASTMTLDSEPATAAIWLEISPDKLGIWKFKVEFLGTYFPAGRYYNGYIVTNSSGELLGSAYYKPSSTQEQTLTVQQDLIWSWPAGSLPTDYWTRPASLNNRDWWPILGNYPGTGYVGGGPMWDKLYPNTNVYDTLTRQDASSFIPWVQAPNSAHVVWKRQGAIGGLIGGTTGIYGTLSSPGEVSVIYSGRAYQTYNKPGVGSVAQCYDLRTGEIIYEIPSGVTPQSIAYVKPGALADSSWSVELINIGSGRLLKTNPWTGLVTGNYSISPLTTGTFYRQIDGYALSLQNLGNSTNPKYRLINWTTRGTSSTLAARILNNISWPWAAMPGQYVSDVGACVADFNVGIAAFVTRERQVGSGIQMGFNVTAINLVTGEMLPWKVSLPDEASYNAGCLIADHGMIIILTQNGYYLAYNLQTGQLVWKSDTLPYPWAWNGFGSYEAQSAYGMFFRESYDGIYAFNWTNGKVVWHYEAQTLANFETPYITNGTEHYSFNSGALLADGKLYVQNSEHTTTWPYPRGWGMHCLNITTGELIWKINNGMSPSAIADGYLIAPNSMDGYTYTFGKGKSTTTVAVNQEIVTKGTKVMIKGTVMDQSPAQPNTPCVSKDSMRTQMEYLHLQMPTDGLWHNETVTGVQVTLTALSSDGSSTNIGTVTTDGYYGTFSQTWTPPAEGEYKIIASFAGDESYGSSSATTAISVDPAPTSTDTGQQQITVPDYTMTIIGAAIAIIIAVAIAVAINIIILKKH